MRISDWSSDVCSSDLLFLEAEGIVAPTVEALRRHAAKVADAGHRDGDQPVEKFEHPRPAQGHLATDRHAFAQLETGDRLLRLGDDRLLARDQLHFRSRSEEHTSELQSLMRISYAVFCLKKKKQ